MGFGGATASSGLAPMSAPGSALIKGGTGTSTGGIACPPGNHREGTGGAARCVPDPAKPAGGAGGGGGGAGPAAVSGSGYSALASRPAGNPVNPSAALDPNLEAYRRKYEGYQTNLEQGAGHSMDVLVGTQKDQLDAQVEQARQAAAEQGIPFDEAQFRAEGSRGINAAMAQEKLGREKMIGDSYTSGLGIEAQPTAERNQRLGIDLSAQVATNESLARLYGLDLQKYGTDVNAATAANNSLLSFYNNLMSGMFSTLSPAMSMSNVYGG